MTQKTCNTCKHAEVDPWEEPCFKCQSVDAHRYLRWEPRIEPPVVYPVGESPYLIKHTGPVCLSILWDGPVLPVVGKRLEITAINRNFVTVKEYMPAILAEWQKRQLVDDVMVEWGAGGTHENMLVLVDKVLDALGRRDDA